MIECDACGAVAYGNAFCAECRSHWDGGDPLADPARELGPFMQLVADELLELALRKKRS